MLTLFPWKLSVLCAKQKSADVFRLSLSHHLAWLRGGGGKGGMVVWVSVVLGWAAWLVTGMSQRSGRTSAVGLSALLGGLPMALLRAL